MTMTAKAATLDGRPARREGGINYRLLAGGMLTLTAIFVSVRLYQQFFAWTVGLDSTSPEFQTHWMRLLYGEFFVEGVAAAAIWGWLWRTRDRNLAALETAVLRSVSADELRGFEKVLLAIEDEAHRLTRRKSEV